MDGKREEIAIIGGGVAGIVTAWLLSRHHNVTLLEKNDYLGGHTHTIELKTGPDAGCCVDTGFIVYNERTYPSFIKFISDLGVEGRDSEMSFSYWDEEQQFGYAGTSLNGLFAQRKNIFRPAFWRMLMEIRRFGQQGSEEVETGQVPQITIGEYLEKNRFAPEFIEWYILPMGAAIWSMPAREMLRYPAANLLRFLSNHGLLSLENRPRWKTIQGGSWTYVKAFQRQFSGQILLKAQVESIRRGDEGVWVKQADSEMRFDRVVMACHADEALALLQDATALERELLGPWHYTANRTVLHSDV
jgi:predicted NAD/FAD-binding protein